MNKELKQEMLALFPQYTAFCINRLEKGQYTCHTYMDIQSDAASHGYRHLHTEAWYEFSRTSVGKKITNCYILSTEDAGFHIPSIEEWEHFTQEQRNQYSQQEKRRIKTLRRICIDFCLRYILEELLKDD